MLLHDKFIADIWEIFLFIIHCVKNVQIQSFFWSVFPHIRTEYIRRKSPYSVRILKIGIVFKT